MQSTNVASEARRAGQQVTQITMGNVEEFADGLRCDLSPSIVLTQRYDVNCSQSQLCLIAVKQKP